MTGSTDRPLRSPASEPASWVRYRVLAVTALASIGLYLSRTCMGTVLPSESLRGELEFSEDQEQLIKSAFFWTYALAQIPAGWLCDRFGARRMMTIYILGWSACTALVGCTHDFGWFIACWFGVGIWQAGAYPTASSLLRRWFPLSARGTASSVVALGGRIGGAAAPKLTGVILSQLAVAAGSTVAIARFGGAAPWRWVFWCYGSVGLGVALIYWATCRDRPSEHAGVNDGEREIIGPAPSAAPAVPFAVLCREFIQPGLVNFSLWFMCFCQFATNIGWVFLVTELPGYLKERYGPVVSKGVESVPEGHYSQDVIDTLASVPLFVGIAGMLMGGWLTDRMVRKWGLRKGRTLPLAIARVAAAASYLLCIGFDSIYVQVAGFALVAFFTDLGVASAWAFAQDVGGKYVAAILGWGNMVGNFGAAAGPWLIGKLHDYCEAMELDAGATNNVVFLTLAGSFVLAGLAALGIDPTKTIPKTAPE